MLGLGRPPIRIKTVRFYIASARLYPAVFFEIFHYQNDSVNNNPAPVGAAIGRPPVNVRSDVKHHTSAKAIISNVTGRDTAKNDMRQSKRELHFGCRRRTSDARSWQTANSH